MNFVNKDRATLALFAELLIYPQEKPLDICERLMPLIEDRVPEAGLSLQQFSHHVNNSTLSRLQELFTSTFDVQVVCYPYLGYQLFGESYKRGTFMVRLIDFYKKEYFTFEKELPDHLSVVLRFMSQTKDDELFGHLLEECIIPSLEKMKTFFRNDNPYGTLLEALSNLAFKIHARQESALPV